MSDYVRGLEEIPVEELGQGRGTTRQVLTSPQPGSAFHMRRFTMQPGGGIPRHDNQIEHQQLVLGGEATIGLGDDVVRVKAGDVLHIPAGLPHWYRVEGDEPFVFLCAVPNGDDRIRILDDPE